MSTIRSTLFAAVALTLTACSSAEDPRESTARDEQALRTIDPCATVLCVVGTHCVANGRHAACVPDPVAGRCSSDADCRLFDDYCDGCACRALSTKSPDPVCTGSTVACFVQPCAGKTAVCSSGMCVVSGATL